jgi:hypothetical protein
MLPSLPSVEERAIRRTPLFDFAQGKLGSALTRPSGSRRINAIRGPATPERQQRRVKLFLPFLAKLLETRIAAQRVPKRIEPKKGRRNPAVIGRL